MVCEVDFGWAGAVGPGESAGVGDFGLEEALAEQGVVGSAAEEQAVGVGAAALGPRRVVVDFGVIAGLGAVRAGTAAVAGVADDALVCRGDAFGTAEIQRPVGVILEYRQVVNGVGGHPDQVAHRKDRAASGLCGRWHRDGRVVDRVCGLVELVQCRGDDDGDRQPAVLTEFAGGDAGAQPELDGVV